MTNLTLNATTPRYSLRRLLMPLLSLFLMSDLGDGLAAATEERSPGARNDSKSAGAAMTARNPGVAAAGAAVPAVLGDGAPSAAAAPTIPVADRTPSCSFDFGAWRRHPLVGINLAGPAFGPETLPGEHGRHFVYPTADEISRWQAAGVRLVRLMFQWERLQPEPMSDFNPEERDRIRRFLSQAAERGMSVIIGPHNYGRYSLQGRRTLVGSAELPVEAFANFWRRMAREFRDDRGIFGYSLMNEPHDTNRTWKSTAQAGLDAIRVYDRSHLVLVPGDEWSNAGKWPKDNGDLLLDDPSRCLMYDAHLYFDHNGSGFYERSYDANGATPSVGAERVAPFLQWLEQHGVDGIITEFGVPNDDPRWLPVLDNFLKAIAGSGVGGTYWAAGSWWGDYRLSIEPRDGKPAPMMSVLGPYLRR